jgi:hypothetical protein
MLLLIHKIVWLSASVGSMVMGKEISATVTIINSKPSHEVNNSNRGGDFFAHDH